MHVSDRERDLYELCCLARELGAHFVLRTVVDQLAGNGEHTVKTEVLEASGAGKHAIPVRLDGDMVEQVTFASCRRRAKQMSYPALDLTVFHDVEMGVPVARRPTSFGS